MRAMPNSALKEDGRLAEHLIGSASPPVEATARCVARGGHMFMKFFAVVGLLGLGLAAASAANTVSSWTPIFKGIEQASGTNNQAGTPLSVYAVRVDLQDP